ncbi:MAG: sodium:solute symporter [Paludibacteraceae bacterium]|nr:sodium:solute symporter [Paludibacteraceae bacterium]
MLAVFIYISVVAFISFWVGRKKASRSDFFNGGRRSPWQLVALGMVSASVSGISVVSVPGMVGSAACTYMQMVFGFILGYVVVAYLLLPVYYRLNLTSIYSYLELRFGRLTHRVGGLFFLVYKMVAAASKLYLVLVVLQYLVLDALQIPFVCSAAVFVLFIFGYTCRTGIRTLVWTDAFQTVCMVSALLLIAGCVIYRLDSSLADSLSALWHRPESRIFVFDDFYSRQNFFKQFFSGMFIVVVMTGLDQDVMQKNLSCPNLQLARRNMLSYGVCFVPVNFLLLSLGVLLLMLAEQQGLSLPERGDQILPFFAMNYFGGAVAVLFLVALLSAAMSSADSALVSLTTSFAVDILSLSAEKLTLRRRLGLHFCICVVFLMVVCLFRLINSQNALDAIYTIVSYLNGPLLGLFAFGLFTHYKVREAGVPFVCLASPVLCYIISALAASRYNYLFGYELLLLNGMLTFFGLWWLRVKKANP